jgi:hypothetical protein
VWQDHRDGNAEVYYKRSTDGGLSWDPDTRLTNNSANSQFASVAVSGAVVHVVWEDGRDGNSEIYYRRNPTGDPTGVKIRDDLATSEYQLLQNYPNPFNPSTTIAYQLSTRAHVTLKVYDVLGRKVATLVNEEKAAGRYTVSWDATKVASGVYFYEMRSNGYFETRAMLLLR